MDKRVFYAAIIGVSVAAIGVALKLGLFEPNSRAWHNGLFGTVYGVALIVTAALTETVLGTPPLTLMVGALLGALSGAIAGLLWSYFSSLDRRSAD